MQKSRYMKYLFNSILLFCSLLTSCKGPTTIIPKAPDYKNATMWYTVDGDPDGTGADVFYIVSTWEEDWTDAKPRCKRNLLYYR